MNFNRPENLEPYEVARRAGEAPHWTIQRPWSWFRGTLTCPYRNCMVPAVTLNVNSEEQELQN